VIVGLSFLQKTGGLLLFLISLTGFLIYLLLKLFNLYSVCVSFRFFLLFAGTNIQQLSEAEGFVGEGK
jgi:hypothetical protein